MVGKGDAALPGDAVDELRLGPDASRESFDAAANSLTIRLCGCSAIQGSKAVAARKSHRAASPEVAEAGGGAA